MAHLAYNKSFVGFFVVVDNRDRLIGERLQSLSNGLHVVVQSTGSLPALQKPIGHYVEGNFEVYHHRTNSNLKGEEIITQTLYTTTLKMKMGVSADRGQLQK